MSIKRLGGIAEISIAQNVEIAGKEDCVSRDKVCNTEIEKAAHLDKKRGSDSHSFR